MKRLLEFAQGKDIWWGFLSVTILFALIGFGVYGLWSGRGVKDVELILVQLISFETMLLGFRYGSSKGSKDKEKDKELKG